MRGGTLQVEQRIGLAVGARLTIIFTPRMDLVTGRATVRDTPSSTGRADGSMSPQETTCSRARPMLATG